MNNNFIIEISLINKLENIVFVTDPDTKKIIFVNDYTKKKFEDYINCTCFQLISGNKEQKECPFLDDGASCQISFGKAHTKEIFNSFSNRYYEIQSSKTELQDPSTGIIHIMIDITERKQYEEALKYNENLFRSIFESFIDVYFQANLSGSITLISPSCFQLTGYAADELHHVNLASLLIDNNSPEGLITDISTWHELRDKDLTLIRKDSHRLPVSLNCRILVDKNNKPFNIEGTIRDNSSRIQAEVKLKEAAEQAIEAQKMRNEFIANMNHELRTPLNGILGYTQILLADDELNEKQASGIEVIERSASHLLGLINDILDLSKIEAGKMELQSATFSFPELIKTIYDMISIRARDKRIGFILNKKTELPSITVGDKKRLGQVLLNLLTNAVKFTDFGKVTFNISYENGRACFEVIDTGFGIPQDQLANIFEPFNQLSEHTQKSQGTGLGLSISKKIVNKMSGNIEVESELGKGSRFRFDIPMRQADESKLALSNVPSKIVGYDGAKKTILVVDDEKNDRKLLKALLYPKGFDLVEATDGIDVLKFVEKEIPDLILLDLVMPQLNGAELTKELRSSERTRNIPIVVISAFDPREIKDQFTGLGVSEFILKPVEENNLLKTIKNTLGISWNYLDLGDEGTQDYKDITIDKMVYPDIESIVTLNKLVMRRNFSKLHESLSLLEKDNAAYKPFVKRMKKLANSFNSAAISMELRKIIEEMNVPAG